MTSPTFQHSLLLTIVLATTLQTSASAQSLSTLPPLTATTSATEPRTYFLGPGDVLDIKVYDYEEYTGTQIILPDGTITLPLVGRLVATHKTPDVLTQEVTARLKPLLKNPVVTIGLNKLRPLRVNVSGEVQRPGPIQLQSLAPVNAIGGTNQVLTPTLTEALLQAGGVNRNADIRRVVLKRYSPNGDAAPVIVNLWEALRSENASTDQTLMDGDTIFVPKAEGDNSIDRRIMARAVFSPKTVRVRVVGEVQKPGEVEVPPDSTLSSAVAIAGGPTEKARLGKVTFVLMYENCKVDRRDVDLRNLTVDQLVQDGDVLIVHKSVGRNLLD
ncbi:MAG: polysaccharide export protein, partial [Phormidesmis sp. CAN_BIN44]|nr:polysaccharide export protein [Phormidesmis sp. CAN_BIN44]